jgi:hypothetical protein
MNKRMLLGILMAVFISTTAYAQTSVFDLEGNGLAYEKITTAAVIGFTSTKVTLNTGTQVLNAKAALITVEVAAIRFTVDGTTPVVTATSTGTGHLMNAGDSYVVRGTGNIQRFLCINAVASSGALVFVTYYY